MTDAPNPKDAQATVEADWPDGPILRGDAARLRLADVRFKFARGSGPGGQNVNKVNTRAELWAPVSAVSGLDTAGMQRLTRLAGSRMTDAGEIHIVCGEHRSQEMNRVAAIERLQELLVKASHRPRTRRKTKPTRGSKLRRLEGKKRRGQTKQQRRPGGW